MTYRQGGMSAEVVLHEAPVLPAGFSDRTRLEVYTEFTPDTPAPKIEARFLRQEPDPKAHASATEPDFTDESLTFGQKTTFVPGRAFAVDGNAFVTAPQIEPSTASFGTNGFTCSWTNISFCAIRSNPPRTSSAHPGSPSARRSRPPTALFTSPTRRRRFS